MFTEEDLKRQNEEFEKIQEEFARLQEMEKQLRKNMGLPEEGGIPEATLTPEIEATFEEAKARAAREGAARATQFQSQAQTTTAAPLHPGRRRAGIVRL
ncbi:MAG: hypothetical protein IJS54_06020 [Desulfovibrio sp.]|nr:hypothetical protein [Desulfovibrio sp.]